MVYAKYEEYISQYDLKRFVSAHKQIYPSALKEIQAGRKQSHWMWCIFPQLRGLGHSRNSDYYLVIVGIPIITVLSIKMRQ